MGFPTRACREPTSDDAMKQSLRLVSDVSLSMSWKAESLPAGEREGTGGQVGGVMLEWGWGGGYGGGASCWPHNFRFTAALGNYRG